MAKAKARKTTVAAVRYVHTEKLLDDPTRPAGGAFWEGLVNQCADAATAILESVPVGYSPYQRNSLTDIFSSMKATHRGILVLIRLGDEKPESVDALVLARLQLEALYTMCLLIQSPRNVDRFTHEAWKRQYIRWLLFVAETDSIASFADVNIKDRRRLDRMAEIWGVTEAERLTIEYDQKHIQPPDGFVRQPIPNFPTPGGVIEELPDGSQNRMLARLYVDYQDLCAFAHGRPVAGFNKSIFDGRAPVRREFISYYGEAYLHESFYQTVLATAQVYSVLSVAQAAAELIALYPTSIELRAAVTKAWTELSDTHMLLKAVWNIRTKEVLGALG